MKRHDLIKKRGSSIRVAERSSQIIGMDRAGVVLHCDDLDSNTVESPLFSVYVYLAQMSNLQTQLNDLGRSMDERNRISVADYAYIV